MEKQRLMFPKLGVRIQITKCTVLIVAGGQTANWELKGNMNMGKLPENGEDGTKLVNYKERSGSKMGRKQTVTIMINKAALYPNPNMSLKFAPFGRWDAPKAACPLALRYASGEFCAEYR